MLTNEIQYQLAGSDRDEFIEIAIVEGYDLSNHRLQLYDANGLVYDEVSMTNTIRAGFTSS